MYVRYLIRYTLFLEIFSCLRFCRRLKHELNSFDEEFFEQLEDLKYKYTELQGIVGEDPMIKKLRAEHKKITSDMDNVGGYRSIDDLPWTRRDPTTIADKSSMTGSLYRRREGIVSEMPPSQATLLRNTGNPLDSGMGGKTISLCEQRLIYAMDELADPLKTIRELCRKYVHINLVLSIVIFIAILFCVV